MKFITNRKLQLSQFLESFTKSISIFYFCEIDNFAELDIA